MKHLSLILVLVLCFSLVFASCGEAKPEPNSSESKSEEISDKKENSEVSVSKEDEEYHKKFLGFAICMPYFSSADDLSPSQLTIIFRSLCDDFDLYDYELWNKGTLDRGNYQVPFQIVADTLQKYLGKSFDEKIKKDPGYDSKANMFVWEAFVAFGGATMTKPANIVRNGSTVMIPYIGYDTDGYTDGTHAELTIEEHSDGTFRIISYIGYDAQGNPFA